MGIEDVVDGKFTEETPAAEAPQPEAPAEAIEPVAEPAPETPPEAETPEPAEEARTVPLATALDWRDGKKDAERRAQDAERKLAEFEASRQPQNVPDPLDDPKGYNSYLEQQLERRLVAERFESSNEAAREKYGDELVEGATAWALDRAAKDPVFASQYMRERRPIDWIVRQHKREGLLSQIGDGDPDAFVRDYLSKNGERLGLSAPAAAPVVAVPQQAPATPPRSLASSPSKHGGVKDVPTGPLMALSEMFPG